MRTLLWLSVSLCMVCLPAPLLGQAKVEAVASKEIPTSFHTGLWVIGQETFAQWERLPLQVNAPKVREKAFPGQRLTVAVLAQGKDRDALLKGAEYTFTVAFAGDSQVSRRLRPVQVRHIKAEGADFVQYVQRALKLDAKEAEDALSMVSLALFDMVWAVPEKAKDGEATLAGEIRPATGSPITLEPTRLKVRSANSAVQEGAFKDRDEMGTWVMSYYQHPEPYRLLSAFRLVAAEPQAMALNQRCFFVDVLKASPAAAQDLLGRLKGEERATRMYALMLLREAGIDVQGLLKSLPKEEQALAREMADKIPALPDPYDLSPDQADPQKVPQRFDMLWSRFLATGQMKPVQAIAGALAWRDDHKVVLEAQETFRKTGQPMAGKRLELVRGIAYMAAGWSLGSFVRSHGLVADFVDAWQQDAGTPPIIREELGTLIGNPAFSWKP